MLKNKLFAESEFADVDFSPFAVTANNKER